MDQQKAFTTTFRGFEKKAVLDYIYEQDMLQKKKEADWEQRLADREERLEELERELPQAEDCQERLEELTASYAEAKETNRELQTRYDKLGEEVEQLVQTVRQKDRELQLQLELNGNLKQRCEQLESKLKILADHVMAERELATEAPKVFAAEIMPPILAAPAPVPAAAEEPDDEVVDLKEELEEFRSSVSKTLLNFEAALARLESGKPDGETSGNQSFFR